MSNLTPNDFRAGERVSYENELGIYAVIADIIDETISTRYLATEGYVPLLIDRPNPSNPDRPRRRLSWVKASSLIKVP